jgi:ATP-dependent exoDNAse (exonuclease V) beta subunit
MAKNSTLIDNACWSGMIMKGTLMIVGDPKQSIYRWRGGGAVYRQQRQ